MTAMLRGVVEDFQTFAVGKRCCFVVRETFFEVALTLSDSDTW